MRTTLDLENPILEELRALGKREGRSLGDVASRLLAEALSKHKNTKAPGFSWKSQPMKARVDLSDKEALFAILDRK
ncbi:MAG: antitoxin [Chthoniobacterales bacterium]|jgi:hypothetical protein|nr:antitoxin [Chthoniobacterales bacterium]